MVCNWLSFGSHPIAWQSATSQTTRNHGYGNVMSRRRWEIKAVVPTTPRRPAVRDVEACRRVPQEKTRVGTSRPDPSISNETNGDVQAAPLKIKNSVYKRELARLQVELIKLQEWIKHQHLRVVVIFEGRDAAGKGGAIKRITEHLNPRICRIVALPRPTDREKTCWYFQRYVAHLPAAGELVLFDRSWYNRAGVEHVMGFCNDAEYQDFCRPVPS